MKQATFIHIGCVCLMAAVLLSPIRVSADLATDINKQTQALGGQSGAQFGTPKDPREIISSIIKSALGLMGTLILVYMVYGGYLIMLSNGDEDKVSQGKKTIVNATIGLGLVLSAYGITLLIARLASGETYKEGTYCDIQLPPGDKDPMGGDTVPFAPNNGPYKDCIIRP